MVGVQQVGCEGRTSGTVTAPSTKPCVAMQKAICEWSTGAQSRISIAVAAAAERWK